MSIFQRNFSGFKTIPGKFAFVQELVYKRLDSVQNINITNRCTGCVIFFQKNQNHQWICLSAIVPHLSPYCKYLHLLMQFHSVVFYNPFKSWLRHFLIFIGSQYESPSFSITRSEFTLSPSSNDFFSKISYLKNN